jgi:hypothetical protein
VRPFSDDAPARRIAAFEQDGEGDPPWQQRAWVTTPEGRAAHLGTMLRCMRCLDAERGARPAG